MTQFLNTLTPYIALLFLAATVMLALRRNVYPLIMRLWFYHMALYWCANTAVVLIYGHYMNPQLINIWASAIAIQAAASVAVTVYANKKWKPKATSNEV